jgi:putative transposase
MSKYIYPTDLTDKEWEIVSPYLPPACPTGRPHELALRDILNTIFYLVCTGCQWRMLPKDYPN